MTLSDLVLFLTMCGLCILAIYGPVIGWLMREWWSGHGKRQPLPVSTATRSYQKAR